MLYHIAVTWRPRKLRQENNKLKENLRSSLKQMNKQKSKTYWD